MNVPPRPRPPPPPPRRDPLELAIERRARQFDVPSLLDLLKQEYPDRALFFRSLPAHSPRPSIIESIHIRRTRVIITVNLGLMAANGPLPSYFLELLGHPAAGAALSTVIEALDQSLLRARLATFRPEASAWLFGDVERTRRDIQAIARPATLGRLHELFSAVFPELTVRVDRTALRRSVMIDRARLGSPVLGVAALGAETAAQVAGFDVVLRTAESRSWGDQPWGNEARRRVDRDVLPILEDSGTFLRVFLVDEEGAGELAVGGTSRLGLDPLGRAGRPHVMSIFEGRVSGRTPTDLITGDEREATTMVGTMG